MDTTSNTVRIFFALWPDTAGRCGLAAWQAALKAHCGGREMKPDGLHVTLVFLGSVAADRLEALKLAAEEVAGECFELTLDEARYWEHNHILYAAPGVVPPQLVKLVCALEKNLTLHRFGFEKHEYKPHVTLLRNAHWTDQPLPGMSRVCWPVRDFVLLQSEGGSYRTLARFNLRNL